MIYAENILICIAIPLIIALFFTEKSTRSFIASFLTGMTVCLLSAYIDGFINYVSEIGTDDTAVYYAPVIEEIMKLLPLLFYMFVFMPDDKMMYTAALGLGLGFATFENCCYILGTGAESLTYILIRGLAVGVMHLVCALALVAGLCLARRFKVLSVAGIVGAMTLSAIFHGLYNLLVSQEGAASYFGYIMPVVTAALLFYPYRRMFPASGPSETTE